MTRRHGALVVAALATAALLAAPQAAADPFSSKGCTFTHGLHPASDSSGSWMQLDLDAACPPDSGIRAIEWSVLLYATGGAGAGSEPQRYFVGDQGVHERLFRDGTQHYVGRGAPRGEARYCYDVVARYYGLPAGATTAGSAVPEKRSGRRCLDGVGT